MKKSIRCKCLLVHVSLDPWQVMEFLHWSTKKNCSSQLFCYLLSLTPMLICKYWLLKVQMPITRSCDIPPEDQHTTALRMYWLWWPWLLRKGRFLRHPPRCRDLQLQFRRSYPGPQGNRWQTGNEKLMPLKGDFSRHTKQQFRNLTSFAHHYPSLDFRLLFSAFP